MEYKHAPPEDGSNTPLASSSPHFLLYNGMMLCSCLNIKPLEITQQGRMRPKLNMVTLNHIKHKPVGSKAPPLIQKVGNIPTCITEEDDRAVDHKTSGMPIRDHLILP